MKKLTLILFSLVSVGAWSQNSNSWLKLNDFGGGKREQAVAVSIGNYGYIGTGIDTAETVLKDWWQYDPATDSWSQKADLPGVGRRNAMAFATSTKAYVGMGIDNDEAQMATKLADFYEYDPNLNSWTAKANFPGGGGGGVYYGTGFSLDNKGYICCGKVGPSAYINELWEYKPSIDQWAIRAPFPGGNRYNITSVAMNSIAYVGLGTNQDSYTNDWWKYNPGTNQWTQETDFIGGDRGGACAFALNGHVYVTLGTNGGYKEDLFVYNTSTKNWYPRAYYGGSARKQAVAFTINGSAYVGTGSGSSGKKASMYQYFPAQILGIEENEVQVSLFPNPSYGQFAIQSDQEIYGLEIYNQQGVLVRKYAKDLIAATTNFELPAGIYLVNIYFESGQFSNQKIIINP